MYTEIVTSNGGCFIDNGKQPYCISFWNIPGGYDHANAHIVKAYFENKSDAEKAAKEIGEAPPEMAMAYHRDLKG